MTSRYNLQPLRIFGGWEIIQNKFLDIDPSDILDNSDSIWFNFTEDILQIRHTKRKIIIDLGWYPDIDPSGNYRVTVVKDEDWENPIEKIETRSKVEVTNSIENIIKKYSNNLNA